LVLDRGDGTLFSPINGISILAGVEVSSFNIRALLGGVVTSVEVSELNAGKISEFVKAKDDVVLGRVDFEDLKVVFSKGSESAFIFVLSGVKLVVGKLPLAVEVSEELFFELKGAGEGREDEEGKDEDSSHLR
jgi:hypothetical protein